MRTSISSASIALLVVVLGGCFTADVTLNPNGSGTMKVTYLPMWSTTEALERKALQGPGVTVHEVKLGELSAGPGGIKIPASVDARVDFASVAELAGVERLMRFQVELADAAENTKRLTVSVKTDKPQKALPFEQPATIRIRLPGDVIESSATVEGRTVVWTFSTADYFGKPGLKMTATYKVAALSPAPAGEDSAGAPGAGTQTAPGAAAPGSAPASDTPARNPS